MIPCQTRGVGGPTCSVIGGSPVSKYPPAHRGPSHHLAVVTLSLIGPPPTSFFSLGVTLATSRSILGCHNCRGKVFLASCGWKREMLLSTLQCSDDPNVSCTKAQIPVPGGVPQLFSAGDPGRKFCVQTVSLRQHWQQERGDSLP